MLCIVPGDVSIRHIDESLSLDHRLTYYELSTAQKIVRVVRFIMGTVAASVVNLFSGHLSIFTGHLQMSD